MTESKSIASQWRAVGLTVGLLMLASALLAIAIGAVGAEVLSLPESRQEAADIAARLPTLRTERDQLTEEIAQLRSQLSNLRPDMESADRLAKTLPDLQAEELRTRAERERLAKDVDSLTSNRSALQAEVDRLEGRAREYRSEVDSFSTRAQESRTQLDTIRRSISEEQRNLARAKEDVTASKADLAQVESDLANASRLLNAKRAELGELTSNTEVMSARLQTLTGDEARAREKIRQLIDTLSSLYGT